MIALLLFPPPQPSAFEEKAIEKVDDLLESYMGIRDSELGKCACAEPLCGDKRPRRCLELCMHPMLFCMRYSLIL